MKSDFVNTVNTLRWTNITMENHHHAMFMGKSAISIAMASIAFCVSLPGRVMCGAPILLKSHCSGSCGALGLQKHIQVVTTT